LLASEGYEVEGVDFSTAMVAAAQAKVGKAAEIRQGDAASPPLAPSSFDVVFARHVLWALPEPAAVVDRWRELLRPGGRLVLVEGRWHTGAGITADECRELVGEATVTTLDDPRLWGGPITDERYLLVSA
jgi:SAM-dependent methyltransferase